MPRRARTPSPELLARARPLFAAGRSVRAVARALCCAPSTAHACRAALLAPILARPLSLAADERAAPPHRCPQCQQRICVLPCRTCRIRAAAAALARQSAAALAGDGYARRRSAA